MAKFYTEISGDFGQKRNIRPQNENPQIYLVGAHSAIQILAPKMTISLKSKIHTENCMLTGYLVC